MDEEMNKEGMGAQEGMPEDKEDEVSTEDREGMIPKTEEKPEEDREEGEAPQL